MRFYKECVVVAERVWWLMNEEQSALFTDTELGQLWQYQLTLGMWIQNHILPHNAYLRQALTVLGYVTPNEKSLFLIEFAQQYWKLRCAQLT